MKKTINARVRPLSVPIRYSLRFLGGLVLALGWLALTPAQAQTTSYVLGVNSLVVGPASGSNSVVLAVSPVTAAWTATNNAAWLHLDSSNQSGLGSGVVVFSFDANPAGSRTGYLTIGDQTLSITQAGSTYVPVSSVATLVSGLTNLPNGVAVDGAGNVYFTESSTTGVFYPKLIVQEWSPDSGAVTTLISSGLTVAWSDPSGIAVDKIGDVYVTDAQAGAIEELYVTNHTVGTLFSGLSNPQGVAVDNDGNVFATDTGANSAFEWSANTGALGQLSFAGLANPAGVAVDVAGNVYIGSDSTLYELSPSSNRTTLVSQYGLRIGGVAVDGSGNVYTASLNICERSCLNTNLITLISVGVSAQGVAVTPSGDLFIADTGNEAIKEFPRAFIDPSSKLEGMSSGSDTLPTVVSVTSNLLAALPPTSDSAWLTITGVSNGIVAYSFTSTTTNRTGRINLLGQAIPIIQGGPTFALGAASLTEGPGEGSDSVVLAADSGQYPWTATNNDAWLHLSPGSEGGNTSTNVIFSFDANPGATRTGTLTIAGQTLTVTQAGSTYVSSGELTTVVSSGLNAPDAVAVDPLGNVYIANFYGSISEWSPVTDIVTTLITGLDGPEGLAWGGTGNLYIGEAYGDAIDEWSSGSASSNTLVKPFFPQSVAADKSGNLYYDQVDGAIPGVYSWTASSGTISMLQKPVSSPQLIGVAVDRAGNLYVGAGQIFKSPGFASTGNWTPVTNPVTKLVTAASNSWFLAVDGSGNIYSTTSYGGTLVYKWSAASNIVTTLIPSGVAGQLAVDGLGNLYIPSTTSNAVVELPRAFMDTTPKVEGLAAGSDSLPPVLPLAENLQGPFAPTSDQPWLTITEVTNGVVNFSFTATTTNRSANINLLGTSIPVTQRGADFALGVSDVSDGPGAGSGSVVLAESPAGFLWTATANAAWLHLSPTNQSGTSSANVIFSYDANPGPTRVGTITIGDQTLTVTQAGSSYVQAGTMTSLVSSGISPTGVAVDGSGNVYFSDYDNNAIKVWTPANNSITTLVSNGLSELHGLAVNNSGNVYIVDTGNNDIKEWIASSNMVTTLESASFPISVAVDSFGNLFSIQGGGIELLYEWIAASQTATNLGYSLDGPEAYGVAVDRAGNVYYGGDRIEERFAANGQTVPLDSTEVSASAMAVDGQGNVYCTALGSSVGGSVVSGRLFKWTAANNSLTTLVSAALGTPLGVAVDTSGNLYIADSLNNVVEELPRAFVDTTPKVEGLAPGSDSLPPVLPLAENLQGPFTPTSDQPWLTITDVANGVVNFSFTANTGPARSANINLLGQNIGVTQAGTGSPASPAFTGVQLLSNGAIQFTGTSATNGTMTILTSADLSLPVNQWTIWGTMTNASPGSFQIAQPATTNDLQRYYIIRTP